jgi:dGTP triphosphohydrolase
MPKRTEDKLDETFNALAELSECDTKRKGWQRYMMVGGRKYIRCQAMKGGGKEDKSKQCKGTAVRGKLVCKYHMHGIEKALKVKRMVLEKRHGLYVSEKGGNLSKSLVEVQKIPKEKMEGLESEMVLAVAGLRKYVMETTDEEMKARPYKLFSFLESIAKIKEAHSKILYNKNVTYTREQVQYIFVQLKTLIVTYVKDGDTLKQIAEGWKSVAENVGRDGFKI